MAHIPTASVSTDPTAGLPPLPTLQAWVHRPQAVARCSITDIVRLRALAFDDGEVKHCMRDVFLLDRFPCRFVDIVAWVAGATHRESTVTVTLDDGNGQHVIEAVVRLAQVDIPQPNEGYGRRTFRSKGAGSARIETPPVFRRPDIRVGDTVRVVGRVDEWLRGKKEWIRQLSVDIAAGAGSIVVVDPDEEYLHTQEVRILHDRLYSQPFTMPAAAPTPGPSPSKSILSSVASDFGDEEEEEDDFGPELPDPSKLSASRLTEMTFKVYILDYMTRETSMAMRALIRRSLLIKPVPGLQALFPEYLAATTPERPPVPVFGASQADNTRRVKASIRDSSNEATPRATFRPKSERDAAYARQSRYPSLPDEKTPVRTAPDTSTSVSLSGSENAPPLAAFTIPLLLATPTLRGLAIRIVDARARHEEKLRRKRAKEGGSTARDRQVVADRLARGWSEGSYKLSPADRERKMTGLAQWAIRQAHSEGGLVQVEIPASSSDWRLTVDGYLPLPPELLAPLLVPVVAMCKVATRNTFRSRLERARDSKDGKRGVLDAAVVTRQLQCWGEHGRWERVGTWAVEAALEWGEARGILSL